MTPSSGFRRHCIHACRHARMRTHALSGFFKRLLFLIHRTHACMYVHTHAHMLSHVSHSECLAPCVLCYPPFSSSLHPLATAHSCFKVTPQNSSACLCTQTHSSPAQDTGFPSPLALLLLGGKLYTFISLVFYLDDQQPDSLILTSGL